MDAVSARFFLFRSVMAVMLSQIGVFLLVPALIAFATKFPKVFDNQETAGCSGVGTSIYSYKYDINVWYWIFAVGGGACAGMNSFIGCCCQNIKRKVKHGLDDLGLGEIDLKAFKKK
uniref:Uncharacterized protein LOC111125694 isoform X2 n=1 Tax=Crassostrea virginica TaxID=6565 RepID=A0A8B8DET7_CRAVI|nr:uncharacterized protein LOC111125694 isoform X2 [Crassostrea virginica]